MPGPRQFYGNDQRVDRFSDRIDPQDKACICRSAVKTGRDIVLVKDRRSA